MSQERKIRPALASPPEAAEVRLNPEVEVYSGYIEWYRFADGGGRLYRFGLVELSEVAGRRFWSGANGGYKLVIVLDDSGIGHAYPFKVGKGGDGDYLAPEYVQEKLGQALCSRREVLSFTRTLGILLGRPTSNDKKETV